METNIWYTPHSTPWRSANFAISAIMAERGRQTPSVYSIERFRFSAKLVSDHFNIWIWHLPGQSEYVVSQRPDVTLSVGWHFECPCLLSQDVPTTLQPKAIQEIKSYSTDTFNRVQNSDLTVETAMVVPKIILYILINQTFHIYYKF